MILGITGGSGCGKTTLLECIRQLGGTVFDCDAIYHRLLETDAALSAAIESQFPGCVKSGVLDRKALGRIVFSDPAALARLNSVTHGAVFRAVQAELPAVSDLAAIDAAALFESGLDRLCDVTVAVTAPTDARIRRLMLRDGIPESYARSRIDAQPDDAWFRARCTYVLENDGDLPYFRTKCVAFLKNIRIMDV